MILYAKKYFGFQKVGISIMKLIIHSLVLIWKLALFFKSNYVFRSVILVSILDSCPMWSEGQYIRPKEANIINVARQLSQHLFCYTKEQTRNQERIWNQSVVIFLAQHRNHEFNFAPSSFLKNLYYTILHLKNWVASGPEFEPTSILSFTLFIISWCLPPPHSRAWKNPQNPQKTTPTKTKQF